MKSEEQSRADNARATAQHRARVEVRVKDVCARRATAARPYEELRGSFDALVVAVADIRAAAAQAGFLVSDLESKIAELEEQRRKQPPEAKTLPEILKLAGLDVPEPQPPHGPLFPDSKALTRIVNQVNCVLPEPVPEAGRLCPKCGRSDAWRDTWPKEQVILNTACLGGAECRAFRVARGDTYEQIHAADDAGTSDAQRDVLVAIAKLGVPAPDEPAIVYHPEPLPKKGSN